MQNINDTVAVIKEQLQIELNHPYVKQFIHHPIIDEDKVLYLCSFLQHMSVEEDRLRVYVISVMLVQIALDTHDLVSTTPVKHDPLLLQERQLTVLAGIYYSSLYYYFLSKSGSLQLMNETASSIKEINVEKMKYYERQFQSIDDIMNSLFVMETALIESVCAHFKEEEWKLLLTHAAFLKRLAHEKEMYEQHGASELFNQLKQYLSIHTNENAQHVMDIIETYMNNSRKMVEKAMNSSLYFNEQLKRNLDELIQNT